MRLDRPQSRRVIRIGTKSGQHSGRKIVRRGQTVPWTVGDLIGAGNEGEVYALTNDQHHAIKIYHPNKRPGADHAAKLKVMVDNRPYSPIEIDQPTLPWPTQLFHAHASGDLAGFVMDRIDTSRTMPIGNYCNPEVRAKRNAAKYNTDKHVRATARQAIINLTQTVHLLHNHNIVIGDINDNNIVIDPQDGHVAILDCDSFQIQEPRNGKTFPCTVGRPEYTAPELLDAQSRPCSNRNCAKGPKGHKAGYACVVRDQQHDLFALGVVIFKLFMKGMHPYDCIYTGPSADEPTTIRDRIQRRYFPYGPNRNPNIKPPTGRAEEYARLPQHIRQLFERTF